MNRAAAWLLALTLLSGCATPAPPAPLPESPAAPPPEVSAPAAPAPDAAPAKIRAALARAAPREAALVAAPSADAASIALVRQLDRNVRNALADLERDGGRHITPAAIKRAQTAVTDLQNLLNEFQAGTP